MEEWSVPTPQPCSLRGQSVCWCKQDASASTTGVLFGEEQRVCDFIQASVETNVKAKGRAKQKREQSKRAIPGETK
jgi:hypothetical protein